MVSLILMICVHVRVHLQSEQVEKINCRTPSSEKKALRFFSSLFTFHFFPLYTCEIFFVFLPSLCASLATESMGIYFHANLRHLHQILKYTFSVRKHYLCIYIQMYFSSIHSLLEAPSKYHRCIFSCYY